MKRENPFKEKKVFDSTSFSDKNKLEDDHDDAEVVEDEDDDDVLPVNKRDLAEMDG
jgi:tRNA pseudouridine38-40 synthase